MKTLFSSLFIVLLSLGLNAQTVTEYDFNSLTLGDLDGQDDWVTILHTTGPVDITISLAVGSVVSPDGTQAAYYNGNGGGYGRTATRKATSNFNFDFTQADIVEMEIDMHRNYWGMFFGVGFDADGDGHIAPGLSSEPDDGGIHFNISTVNPDANKIVLPNGNEVIFTADNSGWCRYKMVLDFTAYDGEGAVALSYKIGAIGDWIAIPEVQGLNMGLTPGSGDKKDRTVWDGIFFHGQGGTASYDNILISETASQGELQYIEFPAIANMLTTNPPFDLTATATSGLPVEYAIVEGPAVVNGSTITLTGEAGMVTISANQPGDGNWAPAPEVTQTFEVVDATAYTADLTIRRPADETDVYMTELSPIVIVASAYIDHPEVLHIEQVTFDIEGSGGNMTEKSWGTGYYSSTWTPPDYGTYTMTIVATSTQGMVSTETVTFEVTNNVTNISVHAFDMTHVSSSTSQTIIQDVVFPTYVGSFDEIMTYFNVTCPPLGCDPWDRVGNMAAKGPNGEWVEILRYITPYGVACDHSIDATDYASILQGLVEMRLSIGTSDDGFVVDVVFDYQEGTPEYKYSWVDVIWSGTFPFGDYLNLQPMDTIQWNYEDIAEASKLKVINTGHGWGPSNSQNAAEFYEATHKIKVNQDEFDQHLWVDCNPNPDGCQPQNGTWYYDRAGWCPGSISYVYEYDLTPFVGLPNVEIIYEFFPGYVDYCHPNHPDCITGVTCSDCNDGYNPHYIISGNLVSYSNSLYIPVGEKEDNYFGLQMSPNPAINNVTLSTNHKNVSLNMTVQIFSTSGQLIQQFEWNGETRKLDISGLAEGVYFVSIQSGENMEVKKLVVQ